MAITVIDIIILIILLFFAISGYSKGFIKQTSTILGVILALIISMNYYNDFISVVELYISGGEQLLQFVSFAILFIGIFVFVNVLGLICKKILDAIFLKPLDQAAGAALGLVKGLIIAYLLVVMLAYVPYTSFAEHVNNSFLAARMLDMTPYLQSSLQNIFKH